MKQTLIFALLLLIVAAIGISGLFWAYDVRMDRKHTVTILGPTPIFADKGENGSCKENYLTQSNQQVLAKTGTTFRVDRIRYWKECATIEITLQDGHKGHLVLGVGTFTVDPPLFSLTK